MEMWVLLINPLDAETSDWELRIVDTEKEGDEMIDYLGLRHQHFFMPISKLADILRRIN